VQRREHGGRRCVERNARGESPRSGLLSGVDGHARNVGRSLVTGHVFPRASVLSPPLLSLFQNFDQVTLRAATGLVAGGIPTAGCYVRKSLNTLTQLTVSPEDLCLSPPLLQSISSIDPLIIAEQQAVARTRRGQQHRRRPLVYSARVRRCGPVYLAPRRSPSWPFVSPPPHACVFSVFSPPNSSSFPAVFAWVGRPTVSSGHG